MTLMTSNERYRFNVTVSSIRLATLRH